MKNEFQNVKNEAQVINTSLTGFKLAVKEISVKRKKFQKGIDKSVKV